MIIPKLFQIIFGSKGRNFFPEKPPGGLFLGKKFAPTTRPFAFGTATGSRAGSDASMEKPGKQAEPATGRHYRSARCSHGQTPPCRAARCTGLPGPNKARSARRRPACGVPCSPLFRTQRTRVTSPSSTKRLPVVLTASIMYTYTPIGCGAPFDIPSQPSSMSLVSKTTFPQRL